MIVLFLLTCVAVVREVSGVQCFQCDSTNYAACTVITCPSQKCQTRTAMNQMVSHMCGASNDPDGCRTEFGEKICVCSGERCNDGGIPINGSNNSGNAASAGWQNWGNNNGMSGNSNGNSAGWQNWGNDNGMGGNNNGNWKDWGNNQAQNWGKANSYNGNCGGNNSSNCQDNGKCQLHISVATVTGFLVLSLLI